jgi:hypothetical protein
MMVRESWWLNDIATIPFFQSIEGVGHDLRVPRLCRSEYELQKKAYGSGNLEAILLEPYLTFSGGGYHRGFKGDHSRGVSAIGYENSIHACQRIIQQTRPRFSNLDWHDMKLENLGPEDTVVIDPPYPDCRVSYSDTSLDYESLVDLLLGAKFRWILCGYPHPTLCRLGDPFWARDVRLLCNSQARGERRTECLWGNLISKVQKSPQLSTTLNAKLQVLTDATSLSFAALDAKIENGL